MATNYNTVLSGPRYLPGFDTPGYLAGPAPQQAPDVDRSWLDKMGQNWEIGSNYNDDYLKRYDQASQGLGPWGGQWGGNQLYGSSLLDQLSGQASSNLTNPDASLQMGMLKDQFTGQRAAEQQAINDRYAGYGRGSGVQAAQQLSLADQLNRSESDAKRQALLDVINQAQGLAMGVEGLQSGNFNAYQNRGLDAYNMNQNNYNSYLSNQGQMIGSLGNYLGSQAALDSQNQQTSFGNLGTLQGATNEANMTDYQQQQQYEQDAWGYNRKKDSFTRPNFGAS